MKRTLTWLLLGLALTAIAFLGAAPVVTSRVNDIVKWNGPVATPDTLTLTGLGRGAVYDVEYIYVSNVAGGTATNANVLIKRFNSRYTGADTTLDTLVVWQAKAIGGPAAAPNLGYMFYAPGGIYRSNPGDTLRIITTMAAATSLYVACKFHEGR